MRRFLAWLRDWPTVDMSIAARRRRFMLLAMKCGWSLDRARRECRHLFGEGSE